MKGIKLLLVSIFTLSLSHAGILIEPQLGYIVSGGGEFTVSGANYDDSYSGLTYGARLGYQALGLMAGVSYFATSYETESKCSNCSPTSAKTDYDQTSIGAFAGYNFPIMLRAWVGYHFSVKEEATKASSYSNKGDYWKGSATEIGIGFTPLPLVSLNLIYKMFDYDKFKNGVSGVESSPSGYEPKEIQLAVSVPFNIL